MSSCLYLTFVAELSEQFVHAGGIVSVSSLLSSSDTDVIRIASGVIYNLIVTVNKGMVRLPILTDRQANNAAMVESFATKEVYDAIGSALLKEGMVAKDLAILLSIFQQLSNFGMHFPIVDNLQYPSFPT